MKSQNQQILEYLKNGRSLTQWEAIKRFHCLRLSARILDLRKQGYPIVSQNIYDNKSKKKYARYTLGNPV